jgi:hypothetical protein
MTWSWRAFTTSWRCAGRECHERIPSVFAGLLPRFRASQRYTARADPSIQDRPGHQPGGAHTAAAAAGTPHALQHRSHRVLRAVEARQLRHCKASFAGATGCAA